MFGIPQAKKILIRSWLPLLTILICGLILRILFSTGVTRNDEVNYAHAAYELAKGVLHFDYWWQGTTRLGLYFPVATLYVIFGPSNWTTLFFPMASSLLGIFTVYLIGNYVDSEKTGLIAAFLWALFPLDIFQAGMLRPDGPLATFSALSVFFLILATGSKAPRKYFLFFFCILFLIWALAIKPIAMITVFFYSFLGVVAIWKNKKALVEKVSILQNAKFRKIASVFLVLATVVMVLYLTRFQREDVAVLIAGTATNAGRLLIVGESNMNLARGVNTSMFLLTAPLLLIGVITLLIEKNNKAVPFLLSWFGFGFLYFEWGSISLSPSYFPILNFVEARSILFIMVPAILLIAVYLSRALDKKNIQRGIMVGSLFTVAVAIFYRPAFIKNDILPPWFYALVALTLVFILLSPIIFSKRNPYLQEIGLIFLITYSVSSLLPSPPYHISYWNPQREFQADLREVASYLNSQKGLVIVPNVATARDLNLASDFQLGYGWTGTNTDDLSNRLIIGIPEADVTAFVVSFGRVSETSRWVLIQEFQNPYRSLYLYRVRLSQ